MGSIFKRKGSRFWWIAWCRDGKQYPESSRSENWEEAFQILKLREEGNGFLQPRTLRQEPPARLSTRAIRRRFKNRPGWVYIVQIKHGPTKIGFTTHKDARRRLNDIQLALPYELRILGVAQSERALSLEAELHAHFAAKHLRGEWFDLNNSDLLEALRFADFKEFSLE